MDAPSTRKVRKTVTVVFSDITGSTELGDSHDPEVVRGALGSYFEAMRAVLERHGASVEKYIGDAVMAVFGVPKLHEDDALRAVRAAVEMRAALAALNRELAAEPGLRLEARTGVNTGEVVAAERAGRDRLVTGDAVNVAQRLQQAAAPGEILIGEATRRLVEAAVEVEPLEPVELKGKRQPVRPWRLLGVVSGASAFVRRLDAPMVGRQAELAVLRTAVEQAFAARVPHTMTVLGPAGIGKTRLVNELVAQLGEEARILLGRCLPYGEGITYWPLVEIARQLDAQRPPDWLVGAGSSQETFWRARSLLEELARERPLLVVFDDIQWAEPTFLDLLEYVRGFAADVPLVLLCEARPELLEVRPGWSAPNTTTLELRPLSDAESRQLVGEGVPEEMLDRIVATASGYPLFVEQMVAMLGEGELEVPPTIQALLGARIDRLEEEEREAIERAAVEGLIFHRGSVEQLLPEAARAQLGPRLMSLMRKGLIRPDRSTFAGDDAFRFGHLLIRDVVYSTIPKGDRAVYHERHARWLEQTASAELGEYSEILGYHLEQAFSYLRELGLVDERARRLGKRAAELLGAAGRRAYARSDISAGVNLLERTAALPSVNETERVDLLLLLSVAFDFGGDSRAAARRAAEAVAAAEALRDPRLQALARAQAGAVRLHTDATATAKEYAEVLEKAIAACNAERDEYGLALSWRRLGWVRQVEGRYGPSVELLEQAAQHARAAGHMREESLALAMLAESVAVGPTPVDEAIRRCEAVLEDSPSLAAPQAAGARRSLALLYAMQGEHARAHAALSAGWDLLVGLGETHAIAQGAHLAGQVELLAGDLEAAERQLQRGYETLAAIGDTAFLGPIAALRAEVLRRQGEAQQALALAEEAFAMTSPDNFVVQSAWRSVKAQLLAAQGDREAAEHLAREAVELAERTDALVRYASALLALGDVLRISRRIEDARRWTERALEVYERKGDVVDATRARALRDELAARAALT